MQYARHAEGKSRNLGVELGAVIGDHLVGPAHHPDRGLENGPARVFKARTRSKHQLSAERFTHYADDGSAELERPYLVQYGDGAPVHVRARRGWMPQSRAFIDMRGEVRMTRDRDPKSAGAELETEHLKIVLDRKQ